MSTTHTRIPSAHEDLSNLIFKETGVTIPPHTLRLMIRARWARISALAHAIHEAPNPGETE